ncbi:MAG: ester cyclase, partial [Mycobacterium sp.]|nr:ester cyclase [Mycobacterium sp.]
PTSQRENGLDSAQHGAARWRLTRTFAKTPWSANRLRRPSKQRVARSSRAGAQNLYFTKVFCDSDDPSEPCTGVRRASPDFHNEVIEMVCEGETAAARLVCTGHHEGVLLGIEPTGRAFRYDVAAFFRCRDGALAGAWVLGDLDALRNQLML